MQLLLILVAISLLIAFTTAIPVGYHDAYQELIKVADPSKKYLTKRGMTEIFSPILDAHRPDRSIFTPSKAIPHTKDSYALEVITKTPAMIPWTSPPRPKPKLFVPMPELVCVHAGPYCPPRPLTPIAEVIKEGITKSPVASGPVVPEPVAVGSSVMSASELARKIVGQISVECPNCGYGTAGGVKPSNWLRFVEWVKKVWQKMRGTASTGAIQPNAAPGL